MKPESGEVRRIMMWSPPRARSTMLMRVFEALGCAVFDEPFYAYWLKKLNKTEDPGFAKTIKQHETEPEKIIPLLLGEIPQGRKWYYQKHMAIHMVDNVSLDWMSHSEVINCFLIRNPIEVILSMTEFRNLSGEAECGVEEAAKLVGIPQLERIFNLAKQIAGTTPPIIDANDVLINPRGTLGAFCDEIGMPFDPDRPIQWAPGKHKYDGAWADDWYQKVYQTSCLGPYRPKELVVPAALQAVVDRCMPVFEQLSALKLTA